MEATCIAKVSVVMSLVSTWSNNQLTHKSKLKVYKFVRPALSCTVPKTSSYASQEHVSRASICATGVTYWIIQWQDEVTNTEVLERENTPSWHKLLCQSQRRLRWLGMTTASKLGGHLNTSDMVSLLQGRDQQADPP